MTVVCRNCGHTGKPERKLKGSVFITIILLICYIIPGIIYMIWRRTGLKDSCEKCGSTLVVPKDSPEALALVAGRVSHDTHIKCPDCRELVLRDARKCKHCGVALVPQ
jgi:rRNA maturation protein Nop10